MATIAGTVVDGANAVLRPLSEETPRVDDVLRVLFEGVTAADLTEPIDTSGFSYAVVMVPNVDVNPAGTTDVEPLAYTGPSVADASGQYGGNIVRQVEAAVTSGGAFTPGYLIGILPKYLGFQLAAAMTVDVLVELRKMPATVPGS